MYKIFLETLTDDTLDLGHQVHNPNRIIEIEDLQDNDCVVLTDGKGKNFAISFRPLNLKEEVI